MESVRQDSVDSVAMACYLLLKGQATATFSQSTHFAPSEYVFVYMNTKTPPGYGNFPITVGWRTWKFAVVPVLTDDSMDPNIPINMDREKEDYMSEIRSRLVSSYKSLGILPADYT